MEQWVNGLRAAKEFWAQRSITEEVKLKKLQRPAHSSDPVFIHNEDGVVSAQDLYIPPINFCCFIDLWLPLIFSLCHHH